MNNNSFNQCNVCGRQLVLKSNIRKPDGSFYPPFQGCEVWDDEHKKAKAASKIAKSGYITSQNVPQRPTSPTDPLNHISASLGSINDALKAINTKLDIIASNQSARFERTDEESPDLSKIEF